jgi:hypothetical protein
MNLPASALMFFCPFTAAIILIYQEENLDGIRSLFYSVFNHKKIKKIWYIPTIFLMPVILLLSYWIMLLKGLSLPQSHTSWMMVPILFIVFFFAALCEEIGWMGYLVKPMLKQWSALTTGIILGSVWSIWHIIPYIQAGHGLTCLWGSKTLANYRYANKQT